MRVLDRYLIKSYLGAFIYCALLFFLLFFIIDSFNNLDEFLKNNVPFRIVASYYLYFTPEVFVQLVPVAALVSLLFILGNLSKHNEISAMKASGLSTSQIISPYLFMGVLISFSIFLVNETVIPKSRLSASSIKEGLIDKGRKNVHERYLQNVTHFGRDNRMIFARELEMGSNTLHDVVILEGSPSQTLKSKLTAKRARYQDGRWLFYEVMEYRLNRRGDMVGEPLLSRVKEVGLSEKPDDFLRDASRVDYLNSRQLKQYIENMKSTSPRTAQKLSVDYHYRNSLPFISFVLMLIGAPLAMKTDRSNMMVGIGTSLVLVFAFYALLSVCLALGKGGKLPPFFAAWFANILFGCIGVYLIKKSA